MTIKTTDLPSGHLFRVALCSGITSSTDPSCLSGLWDSSDYSPISIPVNDNQAQHNLTTLTFPVFLDPSGEGNFPLPALDVLDHNNNTPGFYCDNSKDPCDMVVTDEGQGPAVGLGPEVTATNSVIIPLQFRAQTSGCPASAPQISTYGSTSIEQLLPTAVDATCGGSNGVVAVPLTTDTKSVVSGYASGAATVGFIDNPQDAEQLSPLKGKHYEFVPIAISASTMAFLAGDIVNNLSVPISTYNLTPNMVAGLITSDYESPTGNPQTVNKQPYFGESDNLLSALAAASPSVTCAQIYQCTSNGIFSESAVDAFDLFNPLSADAVASGAVSPQSFGSFMPDVPTGASYQTTDWLCHAPNPAVTATVMENGSGSTPVVSTEVRVNDPNTAPATLTFAPQSSVWPPNGDFGAKWVFPVCEGISSFPSISGSSVFFSAASSPALQAKNMRSWAYGGSELPEPQNSNDPLAAFGIMDSSQAQFLGLNEASLENASGNFVAPTTASVEAGLAAASLCTGSTISSTCPANTYQFNYSNPDPAAYPMPDITYAIVPTSPQPAKTAANIKNLLTNMINFSTSGVLPSGYYPMPAAMAKSALADLTSIVAIKTTPPTTTTTTTTTTTPTSTTTATTTTPTSSAPVVSGESTSVPESTLSLTPTSTPTAVVDAKVPGSTEVKHSTSPPEQKQKTQTPTSHTHTPIPIDLSLIGLNSASRLLLPFALLLALLCLAGGLLILQRARAAAKYGGAGKKP